MNTLFYGDNLNILRRYIKDESVGEALEPSVDLVYLAIYRKSFQGGTGLLLVIAIDLVRS